MHECTLEELKERFGRFNESDRRPRLFRDLERYYGEAASANVGTHLVVNGSFVTTEPRPNDIDVLLVLRDDLDLTQPVPPYEYNARSKKYVRREFGLDLVPVFEKDHSVTHEFLWWYHGGNRAIRIGNWKLVSDHDNSWELYDLSSDRSESLNAATAHPEKVRELEREWTRHADAFRSLALQE